MRVSPNVHVVVPALRIYLTYTLHETEDLLRRCLFRAETVSSALSLTSVQSWLDVMEAARRVILYIGNCQHDDMIHGGFFARGCFGLCAIGAAQDALHQLLVRARAGQVSPNRYETYLVRPDHSLRAMCTNNALVALNQNNQELSALWMQAAQYAGNTSGFEKRTTPLSSVKSWLKTVAALEANTTHGTDTAAAEMRGLAVRFYRVSAACAVGSTQLQFQSAHSAAQLYQKAFEFQCESLALACPESVHLMQRAASTLRRTADQHAAQDAEAEPAQIAINKGNQLAADARCAPAVLAEREKLKEARAEVVNEAAHAKNPVLLTLWQALVTELEEQRDGHDRYVQMFLDGEGQTSAALDLKSRFTVRRATAMIESARKVAACLQSAEFFRTEAILSLSKPPSHQPSLCNRCWTLAATHMDNMVQEYVEGIIVDGKFRLWDERLHPQQKVRAVSAAKMVSIVEDTLSRAVNYIHVAQSAESGGRDPREAQYWRGAAECLVEIAEKKCAGVVAQSLLPLIRKESSFATAAEYLQRAFNLRAEPPSEDNERMCQLYEVASITMINMTGNYYEDLYAAAAETFIQYTDFDGAEHCPIKKRLANKGVVIATEMCRAVNDTDDSVSADRWRLTLEVIRTGLRRENVRDCKISSAHASILELAARSHARKEKVATVLCGFAVKQLTRISDHNHSDAEYIAYHSAVAARILSSVGVPQELQDIQNEELVAEEAVQNMITATSRAHQLHAECLHPPARHAGDDVHTTHQVQHLLHAAQIAASLLVEHCEAQAQGHFVPSGRPQHFQTLIDVQGITVMCAMGAAAAAARGDTANAVSEAWAAAVEQCRVTALVPPHCKKKRREGVAVAERLLVAAKALEEKTI